jgi:hypothetical protein
MRELTSDDLEELRRQYVAMPRADLFCLLVEAAAKWNHQELTRCLVEYKRVRDELTAVVGDLKFTA